MSKVRLMIWDECVRIYIHLDLPYHPVTAEYIQSLDAGLRHLDIYTHTFIIKV
jgi:hypothetical protein